MPIRVCIIDEHSEVRRNLVRRLSAAKGILVVGDSGEALAALDELRTLRPDVLSIEVKMKRANGVGVGVRAACSDNRLKVVVFTIYADAEERRKVQQAGAGAAAYLLKDLDTPKLVEQLRAVVEGEYRPAVDQTGGPAKPEPSQPIAEEGHGENPVLWYQRILIPLDGSKLSEQVLPCSATLAGPLGSRIELLTVFDPEPGEPSDSGCGSYQHRAGAGPRDRRLDYLDRIGRSMADHEVTVSHVAGAGNPASQIIHEAEKEPKTLIAMSSHGRSGVTHGVLGNVTNKVFHATTTPLLIVRSRDDEVRLPEVGLNHVIVPLDGSPLAEHSLPHAAALAKSLELTVVLVRVTSEREEAEAKGYLSQVSDSLRKRGLTSVDELVLDGDLADAIVDTARRTPRSLVAITTQGRSSMGHWAMGSVADRVARYSDGPVLVIRAPG